MTKTGSKMMSMFIMGIIVVILVIVADLFTVFLSIPVLLAALFGEIPVGLGALVVIVILALVVGFLMSLAGFKRGK